MGDSSTPVDGGTDSSTVGGLGQPCRSDATCDTGLRCQIITATSNVCVADSSDAGPDSPVNDAGGDAAGDAAQEAGCSPGPTDPLGGCTAMSACLTIPPDGGAGSIVCGESQPTCGASGGFYTACTQPSDCTGGTVCCLYDSTTTATGGCNATVFMSSTVTNPWAGCATSCPMTNMQLCTSPMQCASGSCNNAALFVNNQKVASQFGICQ